jgi:single stranded DNA-binding protein
MEVVLMASFNKVILVANLTRDPEIRYLASGSAVADVSVAVNERFKKGDEYVEEVSFIDVTVFGRTAEIVGEYCQKGSQILIEGRLKQDRWDDKESGTSGARSRLSPRQSSCLAARVVAAKSLRQAGKPNLRATRQAATTNQRRFNPPER